MKAGRKVSFLVTPKEFKLIIEAGILDSKIKRSIDRAKSEDLQIRITFDYESLQKLLTLITASAKQAQSTKRESLKTLFSKIQNLLGLFDKLSQRSKSS